jgi:Myb-like DNA-binding domain
MPPTRRNVKLKAEEERKKDEGETVDQPDDDEDEEDEDDDEQQDEGEGDKKRKATNDNDEDYDDDEDKKSSPKKSRILWTDTEDDELLRAVVADRKKRGADEDDDDEDDWDEIAKAVSGKTPVQCLRRFMKLDGGGSRGALEDAEESPSSSPPGKAKAKKPRKELDQATWSQEEIDLLRKLVEAYSDCKFVLHRYFQLQHALI